MVELNVPKRDSVALITVDMQNDFLRSDSPVMASGVKTALPQIGRLVHGFREHRKPIFHSVRLYRPDGSNVDLFRRTAVEEGMRVLMPGTRGADLAAEVSPCKARLMPDALLEGEFQELARNEHAFYKPRWGAFFGTDLDARLHQLGITTILVCGVNFPTGGRATVYEGAARDYRVIVASDAFGDASEDSLRELGRLGAYQKTAAACLDWLEGGQRSSAA
ncbi:MAG: isochorismatase family cysteine hydrolase [Tistlia sp.]|uniref:cysteine hydrolase family protein n=1 Tax=Tistlia sp. TaxID=3057121 RepID=UPI0034A0E88D